MTDIDKVDVIEWLKEIIREPEKWRALYSPSETKLLAESTLELLYSGQAANWMIDREKVIKGLECCRERNKRNSCLHCPYENPWANRIQCAGELSEDVLALLKEQDEQKRKWIMSIADNQLANAPDGWPVARREYQEGVYHGLQMAYEILTEDEHGGESSDEDRQQEHGKLV